MVLEACTQASVKKETMSTAEGVCVCTCIWVWGRGRGDECLTHKEVCDAATTPQTGMHLADDPLPSPCSLSPPPPRHPLTPPPPHTHTHNAKHSLTKSLCQHK